MDTFSKDCTFSSIHLHYRGVQLQDSKTLLEWRSRPDVYKYFNQPRPVTENEHSKWYNDYLCNPYELRVIITETSSNIDIGMVGGQCNKSHVCILSFYIADPSFRRKGYMKEAIKAFIEYIVVYAHINTFEAHIHNDNSASIACVGKIGFYHTSSTGDYSIYSFSVHPDQELHY